MIKRILVSAINYDHPQRGMIHAFQSLFGAQNVKDFDYYQLQRNGLDKGAINAEYVKTCTDFKPDWVWMQLQDSNIIAPESIALSKQALPKTVFTHWTGDLRTTVSGYLSSICKATDLTLISSTGQIEEFRKAGAKNVQYCQVALDWEEDVLGSQYYEPAFVVPDVLFCGNYYGTTYPGTVERENAVIALMKSGVNVGVVGSGWRSGFPVVGQCKLKEQIHVCRRAKICINVNHFNFIERYYSDRQLVSMASGVPLICHYVPGLEHEFTDGVHLRWYRHTDQLVEIVKNLLSDPAERLIIGHNGKTEVLKSHTWFNRFSSLLPTVEKIQAGL